jgi:hypothetical protein
VVVVVVVVAVVRTLRVGSVDVVGVAVPPAVVDGASTEPVEVDGLDGGR